ncbi:MAG TPA: class I SAM-dependent methyltransferase [Propionibacteriaceae bacterium]|nr:class I SAM-dependent methyltransferase [Propionibacteriaceae bacterium]
MPRRFGIDWDSYLEGFHTERPGAMEQVLSRAVNGHHTPYRWLARAVSARATNVLDLACGAGAMTRELERPGRLVVGVDISAAELELAQRRNPGPWVRGDALRLPFADSSLDAVVSSMGMVVIHPTSTLLEEVARVLRPGGMLAFIAPTVRPVSPGDLRVGANVATRLRSLPRFPGPLELTDFAATLRSHGMRKYEDGRERYRITIHSRADAELMISALYLPATSQARLNAAIAYLEREVRDHGKVDLAVPMRRILALK